MLYLLASLWLLRSLFAVSEATYYWQLKEYRWDRMREFLFQQRAGQGFLFNTFHIFLLVGILGYGFGTYLIGQKEFVDQWIPLAIMVIFLAENLQYLHKIVLKSFKRPRITVKAVLVSFLTFVIMLPAFASVAFYSDFKPPLAALAVILAALALIDRDLNAVAVSIANLFSSFAKRRIYRKAQAKILSRRDLTVIGITGSFGKSSVKEFLSHILSGQFELLKTEKNTNTEIGIAHTILQKLKPHHKIFVCEMGAYHKGEIQLCCQIARPKIGLFTGLNEQHLALFGSLDKTFSAKWELISSLPADGLAVFNGDSPELKSRIIPYRGRSVVCSTQQGDVVADEITVTVDSVQFRYGKQLFVAPLIGHFQVVNLLMCIVVAEQLGMSLHAIAERMKSLVSPDKTMQLSAFSRGHILDDSYNVNPDGLRAALHHLSQFQDVTKIIFFPGVLELGNITAPLHELMGEEVGEAVDKAYFIDPSFSEFLSKGALRGGLSRNDIFQISDQEELKAELRKLFERNPQEKFVFLFESRGAEQVMEWVRSL